MKNKNHSSVFAAICAALILACSCKTAKTLPDKESTHRENSQPQKVNNVPSANQNSDKESRISIQLMNEGEIQIENKHTTITLYGFDLRLADAQATIIIQKDIQLTKLPTTITLDLPDNPAALIKPQVSAEENAQYYLAVYCDNNNNGRNDKGDLMINFDKNFPTVDIHSQETQVFYIKQK